MSKTLFLSSLLLFSLFACRFSESTPDIATNIEVPLAPTSTVTARPSKTATVTLTSFPTRIPTRILEFPDLTPVPTIVPEDKLVFIKNLVSQNPDCILPCWMNITPGQTTVEEAWQVLSAFATRLYVLDNSIVMFFEFDDNSFNLVPENLTHFTLFAEFEFLNETVILIRSEISGAKNLYSLEQVFNLYGKPSEAWFHLGKLNSTRWRGTIDLLYREKGILLSYSSDESQTSDQVSFCFDEVNGIANLWNPKLKLGYDDIHPEYYVANAAPFLEVSGMTIQDFYDNTVNLNDPCIHTTNDYLENLYKTISP